MMLTATPLSRSACALCDKDIAVFRSVLVRRADDFNGGHQTPSALRIENPNLVLIVIGQGGFDGNAWLRGSPDGRRHAASIFVHRGMEQTLFLERRDIDFDLRAGMHLGSATYPGGSCLRKCCTRTAGHCPWKPSQEAMVSNGGRK